MYIYLIPVTIADPGRSCRNAHHDNQDVFVIFIETNPQFKRQILRRVKTDIGRISVILVII